MDDFAMFSIADDEKEADLPEETAEKTAAESTAAEADRIEENADEAENEEKTESGTDKFYEVLETQRQLLERMDSLNDLFQKKIMHTDNEEKIVDEMHRELQKYREDMYAQLIRPVLLDVIEVRDSIMRIAADFLAKPEGEQCIPNETFASYAFDLQDILEKNNVEIYRSKMGDDFTPIRQRAVKKIATSDETMHGKVAESHSCGYSYNGKIISAEKVMIYCYEKPVEETEKSEVVENG